MEEIKSAAEIATSIAQTAPCQSSPSALHQVTFGEIAAIHAVVN
jgi:hypothetical protein